MEFRKVILVMLMTSLLQLTRLSVFGQVDLQHRLLAAVEQNDVKSIKKFVKQGADLNLSVTSSSPFYMFFLSRKLYLDGLRNEMKGEPVYVSAIHANAVKANTKVLKFLVKKGANIDAGDSKGKTPLMYALRSPGGEAYALELLRRGANYTTKDAAGNTAMHYAAFGGNIEGIHMTAAGGSNINFTNAEGIAPIHAAAVRAPLEVMQRMVELGADLSLRDDVGMNVLHYAAGYGDRKKLKWLLETQNGLMSLSKEGFSPIDIARTAKNERAVIFLRRRGGTFNNYKHKELLEAVRLNDFQAAEIFLRLGANPDRITDHYPIHIAAKNDNAEIIHLLLQFRANPEILNPDALTPLEFAFKNEKGAATLELLKSGAEPEDHFLADCMSRLMDKENHAVWLPVLEVLAEKTENLNLAGGKLGTPPLHYAAYIGLEKVVETLLKAGADPAKTDLDGWTALHWAVMKADLQSSHPEKVRIVRSLMAYGAKINSEGLKPKELPHTAPYLARRVPAGATPLDVLTYALPRDVEMDTLLRSRGAESRLTATNYEENGSELLKNADYRTAMMEFNRALAENPEYAPAYVSRGECKMSLSMFQEAERDFDYANQLDPEMSKAVFMRGKSRIELSNFAAARMDFDLAIQMGYDKGESLYMRGKCRLRLDERAGACKDFDLAAAAGFKQAVMAKQLYCN